MAKVFSLLGNEKDNKELSSPKKKPQKKDLHLERYREFLRRFPWFKSQERPNLDQLDDLEPFEASQFLWLCIDGAHPHIVDIGRKLVSIGANVDWKDEEGVSCLDHAAFNNFGQAVQFLIENGASLETRYSGHTPLHTAAFEGLPTSLLVLLRGGADICAVAPPVYAPFDYDGKHTTIIPSREQGMTALDLAAVRGQYPCVEIFLDHGAPLEGRGFKRRTPLHWAALLGADYDCCAVEPDTCFLLVERGANPHAKDESGKTVLEVLETEYRRYADYFSSLSQHVPRSTKAFNTFLDEEPKKIRNSLLKAWEDRQDRLWKIRSLIILAAQKSNPLECHLALLPKEIIIKILTLMGP